MISIEKINYTYEDGTQALNNVSMDFGKGKTIGVIGSNGSGKSTLFLLLMGVLKPSSGTIKVSGENLVRNKKKLREHRKIVNMVFQDPDKQIFYSRVYDDVAFGLRNLHIEEHLIREKVDRSIKEVGIESVKDKPVHFLSFGQKKRVSIAGILAMDPQVVLLDEPSSGLDPMMKKTLEEIITKQSCDKKIVVSSHDMDFIYDVCDYIYIMSNGEVTEEGPPSKVFLKEEVLTTAGLEMPWIVKLHIKYGLPLVGRSRDIFQMNEEDNR